MMSARYSIIIPHYNIPDLLRRSLTSIPYREDVQIIVIDDCSSEQVLAELRKFENDVPYVQFVYSEENKGGGYARNVGLQHAVGKYLLFLDADDFFHDNINAFLDDYKDEDCDIVFFNADSVDSSSGKPMNRADLLRSFVSDYVEGKDKKAMQLRFLFNGPWCKMVRRGMMEQYHIKFDEVFAIDDVTFSYLVGYYANSVKVDERVVYCVTYRSNSVTYVESFSRDIVQMEVLARKNRFLKDHHISLFDEDMLYPIRKKLSSRNWKQLYALLNVARDYGFSSVSLIYRIAKKSIQYRTDKLLRRCINY